MYTKKKMSTKTMVLGAILTAIVVVLQIIAMVTRYFNIFSMSLVLVPIVIGAALCGAKMGAWLGLVFGIVVMATGDANLFFAVDVFGTIVTVLLKGALCGYAAGLTYKLLERCNRYVAVAVSAVVCPVVNTGVFLIGCLVFFMDTIVLWAGGEAVAHYMIFGLVGANFLFELGINIILSPIIVRLINIRKK